MCFYIQLSYICTWVAYEQQFIFISSGKCEALCIFMLLFYLSLGLEFPGYVASVRSKLKLSKWGFTTEVPAGKGWGRRFIFVFIFLQRRVNIRPTLQRKGFRNNVSGPFLKLPVLPYGGVIHLVSEMAGVWHSLSPGCRMLRSSAEQSQWVKGTHAGPPSAGLTASVPQVWGCARFSRLPSCAQFPKLKLGDGVTPLSCPKFQSFSPISLTILKADILHPILLLFSSKWIQNLEGRKEKAMFSSHLSIPLPSQAWRGPQSATATPRPSPWSVEMEASPTAHLGVSFIFSKSSQPHLS